MEGSLRFRSGLGPGKVCSKTRKGESEREPKIKKDSSSAVTTSTIFARSTYSECDRPVAGRKNGSMGGGKSVEEMGGDGWRERGSGVEVRGGSEVGKGIIHSTAVGIYFWRGDF